jgi:hypothetical protein
LVTSFICNVILQLSKYNLHLESYLTGLVLVFHTSQIDIVSPTEKSLPVLSLSTNEQTILDLADGKLALLDSILNGELELKGSTTEIALVYETLVTYLRGAVRCPSFPLLFDHFRDVHNRHQQGLQN